MPARSLVNMRDTDTIINNPDQAAEVFADPVGYLANLGITAELVTITDAGLALPAAA